MLITKVGRKGQIVIPKKIRESAGVEEGDEIIIDVVVKLLLYGSLTVIQKN